MRMKKLLILAVAATTLVACSKTYDSAPAQPQAIGFGTWAETVTRARTITDGAFSADDNFNVFGSKVIGSATPAVVFNGDVVTASGSSPLVWNYAPPRYWDPNADGGYTFYAISPAGLLPSTMTDAQKTTAATTGAFSTDELTFDGTVAYDVLIADETHVATGNSGSPVNLLFNHAASLLDVKVKKSYALQHATVKVTAISLENIINKGTLAVSAYNGSTNKPTIAIANWTPAASSATTTFTGTVESGGTTLTQYGYADVSGEALAGTANYFWQNFVVMPQTLVAASETNPQLIKISYTITTNVGEVTEHTNKTVAFSLFDNADNKVNTDTAAASGWNPNTHYIYTLTLDANKIEFSAEIADWSSTVVNGFYNLVL